MGITRKIVFSNEVFLGLVDLAEADCRPFENELDWILRRHLEDRGVIPVSASKTMPAGGDAAPIILVINPSSEVVE